MPRQTDQSEDAHALPRPELNPLLNPVLGEHMGRWAEVYFTSPPEKREEAVLELLRELEAANPREVALASEPLASRSEEPAFPSAILPIDVRTGLPQCPTCGHENPQSNQFCGMCGAKMFPQSGPSDSPLHVFHPDARQAVQPDIELTRPIEPFMSEPRPELDSAPAYRFTESSRNPLNTNPHDLSLFRAVSSDDSRYDPAELTWGHSPSRPYRFYIGAVLGIVIMALAYMAWRGAQTASQGSHPATPAPPPVATETATPEATPTVPPKANEGNPASAAQSLPEGTSHPPAETTGKNAVVPSSGSVERGNAVLAAPSPANGTLSPITAGAGREELAVAQRYLNGAHGEQRNSEEAAKWLWKSIAKHNSEATLILADLYLKGDGVSKNCDQARVLLDTAARAGMTGAGERLRNLQAFGCQ